MADFELVAFLLLYCLNYNFREVSSRLVGWLVFITSLKQPRVIREGEPQLKNCFYQTSLCSYLQ